MIAERKESGFYLPEDLEGEQPGLGVQLLSTAGFGGELKVRALLLVVFYSGDKHMLNPTFSKAVQSSVWP